MGIKGSVLKLCGFGGLECRGPLNPCSALGFKGTPRISGLPVWISGLVFARCRISNGVVLVLKLLPHKMELPILNEHALSYLSDSWQKP